MKRAISLSLVAGLVASVFGGCGGGGGDDDEGVISFVAAAFSVDEDGSAVVPVTIQRVGGTAAVSVTVVLSDGTASGGAPPLAPPSDYDDTAIVVAWAAGDTADKIVNVPVLDDTTDEPDETVNLVLASPTGGAVVGSPGSATLTILDDDVAGLLQFSATGYDYGENGMPVAMAVTVQRVGGLDGAVSATVVSTDGTACSDLFSQVEPLDYTAVSVVVSFADQDATPVVLNLMPNFIPELLPELDETFQLSLSNLTNGATAGAPSTTTVTIVDDDALFTLSSPGFTTFQGNFGAAVATAGKSIAVGVPGDATPAGSVRFFHPPDFSAGPVLDGGSFAQRFGSSLVVDAATNTLAIGALGNVFVRDASKFLVPRFTLSSPQEGFGSAMIVLPDGRLVIGAPGAQFGGTSPAGAVYVHHVFGGNLLQTIEGVGDSRLGAALALLGSQLLVGAPGDAGGVLRFGSDPLALNFFIGDSTAEPPSPGFGAAVASIGQTIMIGEPDSDFFGLMNGGSAQLFDGSTGTVVTSFFGGVLDGRFGNRIVAIGERYCVQHEGTAAGGSIVVISSAGAILQTIPNPMPQAGAQFGEAMCEFDGVLVVGAPKQDVAGLTDAGVVYLVKLPP